jgi:hypothetical protein
VPADVQQPTSDLPDKPIDISIAVDTGEERRVSVIVPAGTSGAYTWNEDEPER